MSGDGPLRLYSSLITHYSSLENSLASVSGISPLTLSAQVHIRPVSCYALFQWWLLLSQHPGCHSKSTSLVTKYILGTLADSLGCFPFDREDYPSRTHSGDSLLGIRSLIGTCRRVAPRSLSVALPPKSSGSRLPLKAFRREPDISPFD